MTARVTEGWARLSAGDGAKDLRWYDWMWLPLAAPWQPAWRGWLLIRRSLSNLTELTTDVVFAPPETTLATVVQVAGSRWTMERCFAEAKGEAGLEQKEVRRWTGWYRPITLARWAYALLTVRRAANLPRAAPSKNGTGLPAEQSDRLQDRARARVPLRVSEMRCLFWYLVLATQQRVERMLA